MKFLLMISFILSISICSFATSKEEVKQKTSDAMSAASQYTKEQKDGFEKEMKTNLNKLKHELSEMNKEAAKKSASVKQSMKNEISEMEKERKEMSHKLTKLEKSTGQAWDEMKNGMSKSWTDLSDSYDKAKDKYKDVK